MHDSRAFVLGGAAGSPEDELRLPRPPGVVRRFWARHPLATDILIAAFALLLSTVGARVSVGAPVEPDGATVAATIVLTVGGCLALVWRRRWPILVFSAAVAPLLLIGGGGVELLGPAALVAIYSIAVYRSARASWYAFGSAVVLSAIVSWISVSTAGANGMAVINVNVSAIFLLLLGVLIGINIGNRKRYLEALIDRSRQLLIERDQHSRLAAAAERTRIAREMHDIVSHSLTVIVALSEGASVTNDRERAADANGAIAATARSALDEMRVMLGVLRDDDNDVAPLAPDLASSLSDLVDAARAAGFRVSLSISGEPGGSSAARLAVLRIAREGLTNAMRYSHDPAQISLSVLYTDEEIDVSVENDGALSSEPSQGAGYGLKGLGERLAFVGGTLTAGFVADSIWHLRARLPKGDTRV